MTVTSTSSAPGVRWAPAPRTRRFVWARGDGSGGFETFTNIDSGTSSFVQGAQTVRLTPDGPLEIWISWNERSNTIQRFVVPDDPTSTQWRLETAVEPSQGEEIDFADLDGDGDLDLLLGHYWVENDPDGAGWTLHQLHVPSLCCFAGNIDTMPLPDRVVPADVDGDGDVDVVVAHEYDPANRVVWYENPGADPRETWDEHVIGTGATPIHSLDVRDLDGDGDVDVVAGEHRLVEEGIEQGRAWAFENRGGGRNWIAYEIDDTDAHHDGTQLADLDNDGDLDVFSVGWFHNRVLVYENDGGTDNLPPDIYGVQVSATEGTATISWRTDELAESSLRYSTGGAGPITAPVASGLRTAHTVTLDELACSTTYEFTVTAVDAGGRSTTTSPRRLETAACPPEPPLFEALVIDSNRPHRATSMFTGDVDGDGDDDLVLGAWWYEHPDGDVRAPWIRHVIGSPLNDVGALHDFDGDGDLDVWGTEAFSPLGVDDVIAAHWGRNDGTGNFEIFGNIDPIDGNILQGTFVGALDPGGPLHLAVSWQDASKGTQLFDVPADPTSGTWTWETISTVSFGEAVDGGDIDGDGDLDLHLGQAWLENDDLGGWTTHTADSTGLPGGPDRVVLADVDGDGDLDAVVGESGRRLPASVVWYENAGDPTDPWTRRTISSAVRGGGMSLDVIDADGDGDVDVFVGEHGDDLPADPYRLLRFDNSGDGSAWTETTLDATGSHHMGTRVLDLDADGDLDVASQGWFHSRVTIYLGS